MRTIATKQALPSPTRRAHAGRTMRWLPAIGLVFTSAIQAQAWPSKTVRIIVPFSAGATTDLTARLLAQQLAQRTGQTFVVENKVGASGTLGSGEVARAPADGHTLLVTTSSTHAIAPAMSSKLPYNAAEDFTPIARLADSQLVMLGSPSLEVKNAKELIALARDKPGSINYSSSGIGTVGHLASEALNAQANIAMTHIPYKGSAQAIPDLMSGAVQVTWDSVGTGLANVRDGRVKGLAVSGPRRSPLAPDIPTVAESGVPGFSVVLWFGLLGPRGMPPELAQRINTEVNNVLQSPEMRDRFTKMGIETGHGTPGEFTAAIAVETAAWRKVVVERNLKPAE